MFHWLIKCVPALTAILVGLACFLYYLTNYPCVIFLEALDLNIILLLLRCNLRASLQMLPEVKSLFVKRFVSHFPLCDRCACDNLSKNESASADIKSKDVFDALYCGNTINSYG